MQESFQGAATSIILFKMFITDKPILLTSPIGDFADDKALISLQQLLSNLAYSRTFLPPQKMVQGMGNENILY